MKNLTILFYLLFLFNATYSKDKIYIKGGQMIKGEILNLEQGKVTIKDGKNLLEFSPEHVEFIEFDIQNIRIAKIIAENADDYGFTDGQMDAEMYHKRFGGNFTLGLLFGVFGFIGVAIGNVKDPPANIEDRAAKVNDGDYMAGYDKKGKKKNLKAAGIGFGASVVILMVIFAL